MTHTADTLYDQIAADVADALDRTGGDIVDAIREDLSIPVGITTGKRGGRVVVRSKPGEHPRRETGKLQAGMYREVQSDGANATLIIANEVEYAKWLDPLGDNGLKDRPIVDKVLERFEDDVIGEIVTAISGTEK